MKTGPELSPRKARSRAERERRLASALRENLRRRKDQARQQQGSAAAAAPESGLSDSAVSATTARARGTPAD